MAESVVSFVVNEIGKLLIEEGKYLHGASHQAERLQTELNRLLRYLRDVDARARQGESETIQGWISDARDIAYKAENAIECYAFQKARLETRDFANTLKWLACIFKECYVLHHARSEIDSVIDKICSLWNALSKNGIQPTPDGAQMQSRIQELRRTYSHSVEEEENNIVGLEDNLEMLVDHVLDQKYRFVSIIGMGGLGKSTMARKIYKHHRVQDYFDKRAWFCISQQRQTKDVLQGIFVKLDPHKRKHILTLRDEELVRELNEFQSNKRCFIVLDDIWSSDPWECIKEAFPKGTKILLTTRNRQVAEHVMSSNANCFIHQLRLLNKEESWELFQKKAMITTLQPQEFREKSIELGKQIVEHCGGLPLAVITLGGILSTKHTLDEMESVCKNVKNLLGRVRDSEYNSDQLKNIVDLSYYDLPYYLKPCFLYLGMFPEDHEIPAVTLYQLWSAEGFLLLNHKGRRETMMDVADRYLEELVQRCMVEVQSEEKRRRGRRFGSCCLHDVMRELCLGIAEKEIFCKIINYSSREGTEQTSAKNIPRLQLFVQKGDLIGQIPIGMDRHMRSFRILGEGRMTKQISGSENFKMLKVLAIEDVWEVGSIMSGTAISKLIHLRYLSLRDSRLRILPSSISNLQHLQTLIISRYTYTIFDVLRKLGGLRYLHLPDSWKCRIYSEMVEPWINATAGCDNMGFFFGKCKLRLDYLSKLEVLENLRLNNCNVEDLKKLVNLQVLSARVFEKLELVSQLLMNIVTPNLRFMSIDIRSVDFRSSGGPAVLRQILSSTNLSELDMFACKIEKWPRQHEVKDIHLSAIQSLKLWFNVSDDDDVDPMETLEKLPNLQELWIVHAYNGKEMTCHATGFPNLRELLIWNLDNLERIKVEEGAMPMLRRLEIGNCHKLEMIPDGLRFITSLQELYLRKMPSGLMDRIGVGEDGGEGPDFYKIRHVPIIKLD